MNNIPSYLKNLVNDSQLVNILDAIFDGIYITDVKRTIVFWNKGAEQITGYKSVEVVGMRCADNILNHINEDGKLLCTGKCPITTCMRAKKNHQEKVYPKHKDGHRFPVMTHIAPIEDESGKVVGAIEVFRDITKDEDYKILQDKFNFFVQKFISKTTYEEVMSQIKTGQSRMNELKDLTILYLDVVDFTSVSESLSPDMVADLLNDLFGICDVITRECHGDIDKFIGDSIMATFIDANDAVKAAVKILEALDYFNNERTKNSQDAIGLHIGLHSGQVVQVEVGTKDRKDFTVLGDVVNTAARIQGIAKPGTFYISASTYLRLHERALFHSLGKRKLKGKQEEVEIFSYGNTID